MSYAVYEELTENFVDEREQYDKWLADKEQKQKQEHLEQQTKRQKELDEYILSVKEKFGDYWKYNNILIPLEITNVIAIDGINNASWWIIDDKLSFMETLVAVSRDRWNLESYKKQFAVLKEDGKWYWKLNDNLKDNNLKNNI